MEDLPVKYEFLDVRENGTIEGRAVETFYQEIEDVTVVENVDGVKFAAFTSDGQGCDSQTRVPLVTLQALLSREKID